MRECEEAFQDLKKFLATSSILSKLRYREPLYVYLLIADKAISLALIKEEQL